MMRSLLTTFGLGQRRKPAGEVGRAASDAGRKTVFIIEDSRDCLSAMLLALAGETYRIETADHADLAIWKLSSGQPDLILLNSRMPASDGTRLASRLIADENLVSIPMVALGAGRRNSPEVSGQFDGYIEKPINLDSLPGQVRTFFESHRKAFTNLAPESPFPATLTGGRRQQAAIVLNAIQAGLPDSQFDPATLKSLRQLSSDVRDRENYALADYLERAIQLSGATTVRARSRFKSLTRLCWDLVLGDPDVTRGLAGLRNRYLENRCAERGSLEQALRNGDFATLGKAGHNLKSTGGGYGFAELTGIGKTLEAAAKEGDTSMVVDLLDQLESYISMVRVPPKRELAS